MTTPRTRLAGKLAALALCTATTAAQALPPDADLLGMSSYVAAGGYYTAHLVPESAVGQDLDGDGMANDLVLHFRHVDSDESISTGIPAYGFRIETDGSNILFLQAERNVNADLNGDGDRRDVVLAYYTIAEQTVRYTHITPHLNVGSHGQLRSYDIHGPMITFSERESYLGRDANGDGDTNDYALRYYLMDDGQAHDTGLAAPYADVSHERIATTVSENAMQRDLNGDGDAQDAVVVLYDTAAGTYQTIHAYPDHNIINPASYPAVDGWRVIYRVNERNGTEDVDGDGQTNSQHLVYEANLYDGIVRYLGTTGSEQMWVAGDYIAFATSEHETGIDTNGDGDTRWDRVISLVNYRTGTRRDFIGGGEFVLGDLALILRDAEHRYDMDLNGDGDTSDSFAYRVHFEQSAGSMPPVIEADAPQPPADQGLDGLFGSMLAGIEVLARPDVFSQHVSELMAIVQNPDLDDQARGAAALPVLISLVADIDGLLASGEVEAQPAATAREPAVTIIGILQGQSG